MSLPLDVKPEVAPIDESVVALHNLGLSDEGVVVDITGGYFDGEAYSRFKYGDLSAAQRYAKLLARRLVADYDDALDDAYVSSSAYKQVPTAAAVITDLSLAEFPLLGHHPAGLVRIDRGVVLMTDYAKMSAEEREVAMHQNKLEINSAAANELAGSDVLIIDDIRITGSHERAIMRQLGAVGVRRAIFGYIAVMDPETAREHPEFEDLINGAAIKSALDILPALEEGRFRLNARTCKFILKEDPEDVAELFARMPLESAKTILSAIIADGYHKSEAFAHNFEIIRKTTVGRIGHIKDNPKVYERVIQAMEEEQALAPARQATGLRRLLGRFDPLAFVQKTVDEMVEKRQRQQEDQKEFRVQSAVEAFERYDAKVADFVGEIEKIGRLVKLKFDIHGFNDRTWLIPCIEPNTYIATSVRREMQEELFAARAVMLQLPEDSKDGIKYKELLHHRQFIDPADIDQSLADIQAASLQDFPAEGFKIQHIENKTDDSRHFTPLVGLVWSVFPGPKWVKQMPRITTNSTYFQYENGNRVDQEEN